VLNTIKQSNKNFSYNKEYSIYR